MGSTFETSGRWALDAAQGGLSSLHFDAAAAPPVQLGPDEVLVRMHAASLNYRDLVIAKGKSSAIPLPATPNITPGSDGSGTILSVGSSVPSSLGLQPDTRVVTHLAPHLADDFLPGFDEILSGLGQQTPGTLCRLGVFHHSALIPLPASSGMSHEAAATLTCSGLTAWNALMGMRGREVRASDWVLVQGTGGVSIAALQIAVAAGATVIATTSSDAKADRLRSLGAQYVLNYKTQSDWGAKAKELTPGGRGVDHVVDIGGAPTLPQSLEAIRRDGVITVVGMIGDSTTNEIPPDVMSALYRICVFRGVLLGTRNMFKDMVQFFHDKKIDPVVDDITFQLEDAIKAYERLEKQQHFSKVVIKIA
ncbi:zinc-binding alcohol dehydrogenase-like protein [Apiospora saccharicola]|uniref:Zinc-binding alcohol dehydrogenase-like protein n=1 Tax=Apiospora saccharicola TaxID=335842 RepID=A0ABR1UIN6_9PEZI